MEDNLASPLVLDGSIRAIKFSLATSKEICTSSINDCPVTHPSQLTNPFLGLPLESGKCESCGTAEHGQCEGHFGYIQLPVPIYHPCHVSELKHILSMVCLRCLKMKRGKAKHGLGKEKLHGTSCSCSPALAPISVNEVKTTDGAISLELKVSSRERLHDGFWSFLDVYGFRYDDTFCRPLLPCEVIEILEKIPEDIKKRLVGKECSPQEGFILQCLPVPPNCLYVPDICDGKSIMSSDISFAMLKRILNKIELIKKSRSGSPNFESHQAESNDLQAAVAQYMLLRGTTKAPHDITRKFANDTEASASSRKQWPEKMKALFISKGSGFSSRCVITGDGYIGVNQIGIPSEIAKNITFEEKVTVHNRKRLQEVVDNRMCVTYRDGLSTYAIAVGSKGHTSLKIGQVINRRIMDGDIVFINRTPSTHKHSLQAFSVYIHDDHTVKINPLICAPFGADFDGDCVHIFYPQSVAAKSEAVELFSVEQQLLSSHSGQLNLQVVHDSLLALKMMSKVSFLKRTTAQQLSMFVSPVLPPPALLKAQGSGPFWTVLQILQNALPTLLDCSGDRHLIRHSEILRLDFNKDLLQSLFTEIITSVLMLKGPKEALSLLNSLQPLLNEILFLEGFSITLRDFVVPKPVINDLRKNIQDISPLVQKLRSTYNELIDLQVDNHLKSIKLPVVNFILKHSALGSLIDSKSDSAILKVVQQLGFLGLQLFNRGKFYSRVLVEDLYSYFLSKCCHNRDQPVDNPSEAYGLVKNSFFHGLDPYEMLIHSISSREVMVRSSRGLSEPGTLFKNLMAILRDVVVCYDGTVRNICSNSIVQLEYGAASFLPAGEPVGALAATTISHPAYKAVLDSSQSSNSTWELMKEVLFCKVNFKNDFTNRRIILYLNDCFCGKKFCKENAAWKVQNCLKRVTLKDCAIYFLIVYQKQTICRNSSETVSGLVGHIHLNKIWLNRLGQSTDEILQKCQDVIDRCGKKKRRHSHLSRRIFLSASESCSCIPQTPYGELSEFPCLQFSYHDESETMETNIHTMANTICPILLDTIVKGDRRVHSANIIWTGPDTTSWVSNVHRTMKGEVAVEVLVEKDEVKQHGDAWRITLDSCLPIMHLIDIRRSTPYGIQQVQDLLGISCAFDQSVQRLSTAIKKVAKCVLKEHLMLVAHCMTCSGNVIGFNTASYKSLFRSLKVQVPFTEATLSTPMKCFERAAEGCHMDSLSSILAACSWGKHVALGTGTGFQILWNKQQMENSQAVGKDVYEFLHLVKTTFSERETSSACLGVDVDDIAEDNSSPEHVLDFENPTFEDSVEGYYNLKDHSTPENGKREKSMWEKIASSVVKQDGWQGWGNEKLSDSGNQNDMLPPKSGVWSSCSADQVQNQVSKSIKPSEEFDGPSFCNNLEVQKRKFTHDQPDDWGTWKSKDAEPVRGQAAKSNNLNSWNDNANEPCSDPPERSPVWGSNVTLKQKIQPGDSSSFSNSKFQGSENSNIVPNEWSLGASRDKADENSWNKIEVQDGWGASRDKADENSWNKIEAQDGWGRRRESEFNSRVWDSSTTEKTFSHPMRKKSSHERNTGRRDFFTPEEEKIRLEVEPIMQSIRRILHQTSDGDRLSSEDQTYILENVFQYHPDKEAKVGGKIDFVKVDKHHHFQDSRCFFVVSADGTSADFSYIKCMENFTKDKYPENAESFVRKYFTRRRRTDAPNENETQL